MSLCSVDGFINVFFRYDAGLDGNTFVVSRIYYCFHFSIVFISVHKICVVSFVDWKDEYVFVLLECVSCSEFSL